VLLCYANGMTTKAVERTLLLSVDQVAYCRKRVLLKLDARRMGEAVANAWRLALIEADEIEGEPLDVEMSRDEIEHALLTYRERVRHEPPPVESWAELRERAALLALAYRGTRTTREPSPAAISLFG